jgi:hypothetical protein
MCQGSRVADSSSPYLPCSLEYPDWLCMLYTAAPDKHARIMEVSGVRAHVCYFFSPQKSCGGVRSFFLLVLRCHGMLILSGLARCSTAHLDARRVKIILVISSMASLGVQCILVFASCAMQYSRPIIQIVRSLILSHMQTISSCFETIPSTCRCSRQRASSR